MEIQHYSKEALVNVENANFLTKQDLSFVKGNIKEFQDNFEKKQIWRTETEINVSVLNDVKFPTNASKYWQCVRESSVFFENLVKSSFDYKREIVNIKKLKISIKKEEDELEKELLLIDLEESLFKKKNMEIQAGDRVRELKIWNKKMKELDNNSFNTKNVDDHQEISLAQTFMREFISGQGSSASPSEKINIEAKLNKALDNVIENGNLQLLLNNMSIEEKNMFPSIENKLNNERTT